MRHVIFSASCLAALRPGHDYRPALDEIAAVGFSAVRVFAGRLTWCGQEPGAALDRLPGFLQECTPRGLNAHVVALTDTRDGDREAFPRREHYGRVLSLLSPFDIIEGGNEPWDVEQFELTPGWLDSLPRRPDVMEALGASSNDEATDYAGTARWVTAHLDRGRDPWNMVRRVRELLALSEATGRPVMSGEPIGAGEQNEPGKRCAQPEIFYTMAALGQLFGVSTCFHSSDGLLAQPLGARQRACAEAFIAGMRTIPPARYVYKNVGQGDSPVTSARFNDGDLSKDGCTRSYCGLNGNEALNVTLGIAGDAGVQWGNGWRASDVLGRMPSVLVTRVVR